MLKIKSISRLPLYATPGQVTNVTRLYPPRVTSRDGVVRFLPLVIGIVILLLSGLAGAQGGPPPEIEDRFSSGKSGSSQQTPIQLKQVTPPSGQYQQSSQQFPGAVQQQPTQNMQPVAQQPPGVVQQPPGQYTQPAVQQPPGQYQQSPQQPPGTAQQPPGQYTQPATATQQPPGQYQQSPQQPPGAVQQPPGQYTQPAVQQPPGQYQQSPQQPPGTAQQPPGQYTQPAAQQPPGQYQQPPQQPAQYVQPSVQQPPPIIVSGDIKIEGVETILKELLRAKVDKEWQLKAYIGNPKIYLANLKWFVKPDDGTFEVVNYEPEIAVIRLKSKKNIWADPKLKMFTKEYIFHAQSLGMSGGKITSINSILFAQCSFPVEFYDADRQQFDYPSGYKYRFQLQKQDGEFVDYEEYNELGKLTVNLQEEFKKRVIFKWKEDTAEKSTVIKLEIVEDNKILVEKKQKMTSTCRNISGFEATSPTLNKNSPLAATIDHPSLSWNKPSFKKLDNSNLFQITLEDFQIADEKNLNLLNARNYFLEARFFHKDFKEGKIPFEPFQANQFSLVAKILPPHVDNGRISVRGKMDDFSRMGYILKNNPGKWYDGYFKFFVIFDSIPMETIHTSLSYPCRYKYNESIFSKEYIFDMMGGNIAKETDSTVPNEKSEKGEGNEIPPKKTPQADAKPEKG